MNPRNFITTLHDSTVIQAIRSIESRTTAELRVMISSRKVDDALRAAWQAFAKLGMDQTAARNGVLIFIAPEAKKFSIIGDEGIYQRCDPGQWEELAAEMAKGFLSQDYTDTLVRVIEMIGCTLAHHFPGSHGGVNELSDDIARD